MGTFLKHGPEKMTILIVEDDENTAKIMAQALNYEGYSIIICEDGKAALQTIRREKIDIIVSDLNLPYMDGFELHTMVKKEFPDKTFIVYTSSNSPQLAEIATDLGITDFFTSATKHLKEIRERISRAVKDNNDITKQILDS
jgi:CheY-like chemotaxis protein